MGRARLRRCSSCLGVAQSFEPEKAEAAAGAGANVPMFDTRYVTARKFTNVIYRNDILGS